MRPDTIRQAQRVTAFTSWLLRPALPIARVR